MRIGVRTLYRLPLKDIVELRTNLTLVFEDGIEIQATYKEVIIFRALTDFLTKWEVPITSDMWLSNFYTKGYFSKDTYLEMYSLMYQRIVKLILEPQGRYGEHSEVLKDIFKSVNIFVNEIVSKIQDYNIGIEIIDILPIALDEEQLLSIMEVEKNPTQESIEHTYQVLDKVIHKPENSGKVMRLVYDSGMVNLNQLRQLFGSRGFLTEINSQIFKKPMINSFTLGFRDMYEAIIESRAGAKALNLSTKAIQKSEKTAREFQLATMPVEEIVYGDCGNRDYMEITVRPKEIDEDGNVVHQGDLKNLLGSKFLNDKGEWETITPEHKYLEGQTIKLRSVLHCKLRNKKQICTACYGDLAYGMFLHQNVGHINTTNITRDISQSLLSTKHLLKSASSAPLNPHPSVFEFFNLKDEKLFIKPEYIAKKNKNKIYILVPQSQARGLRGINDINILNVNINKISRITNIAIVIEDPEGNKEIHPVSILSDRRYGFFTFDFIRYIRKNGYFVMAEFPDFYAIDISNIDRKLPIIKYERAEFDFNILSDEFSKLIADKKYVIVGGKRKSEYTPEVLVQKLFDLLNKKLSINIKKIEAMVYGFTAYNLDQDNFDLGRNSEYMDVIGLKYAIDYRSIGGSYDWSRFTTKIYSPYMFFPRNKPDHPLDVLFKPNEVLNYYKNAYPLIKDK